MKLKMLKLLSLTIAISTLCLYKNAFAQQGIAARNKSFMGAKLEIKTVENPKIRMFSTDEIIGKAMRLFTDRSFTVSPKFPAILDGLFYFELPISHKYSFKCISAGEVLAIVRANSKVDMSQRLLKIGFIRIDSIAPFLLFGQNPADTVKIYKKYLSINEEIQCPEWTIITGFDIDRTIKSGELLYNGIKLPQIWPPLIDWKSSTPMEVPYLKNRPEIIPIDLGRQLFVDSFLIEKTSLKSEFHYPTKYEGNPILKPETTLEKEGLNHLAVATPKGGGVWWNAQKKIFEMWYEAGWVTTIAYATSKDGIHWDRPNLPLNPGTNQVLPSTIKPDSWTIVKDYLSTDPNQKYKIFMRGGSAEGRAQSFLSKDGLDWGETVHGGLSGDRSSMFFNPFRKKWVYSLRWYGPGKRSRAYWEADDFRTGMRWNPDEPYPWARTDQFDLPDLKIGDAPQLYNLDAVAYESLMLGFFEILHGPSNTINATKGLPKSTGLNFAYSRDGFHWSRPDRNMAINSEQKEVWDRGYVQSVGNICMVRGDKLWFYYTGFKGDTTIITGAPGVKNTMYSGLYANGATGLAFLRRDGFVSLNAAKNEEGSLLTRPIVFQGKHLFVNVDAPDGLLAAELIDMDGKVIAPFSFENCIVVKANSTIAMVKWKTGSDLTAYNNTPVRIRFKLKNGKLYSFWISRDESGRSDGYVAGGGPGYLTNIDNAGIKAYEIEKQLSIPKK